MAIFKENKSIKLPNFLCIGAQRCATTWLFECLREHPEIYIPEIKEINYFSDINSKNYYYGLSWYKSFFKDSQNQRAVGEITPEYFVDIKAPERIKNDLGDIKIIAILRNPIERAYSSYSKGIREGDWDCTFEEFINNNIDLCIDRGLYYKQLTRYYQFFPNKNILVKYYFKINDNPKKFIQDVYSFLNVDNRFLPRQINSKFNIGTNKEGLVERLIIKTRNFIKKIIGSGNIIDQLQRNRYMNKIISNLIKNDYDINHEFYIKLIEIFYTDTYNLSKILNKDLTNLWYKKY